MNTDYSDNNRKTDHSAAVPAEPAKSTVSLSELMHAGLGVPSPFTRDIFLIKQAIVGTRYLGGSDELVKDLKPGSRVDFLAEPDNRFDEHAVMALDSQGRKLGYIPRYQTGIIGSLLKAGKVIYGIVPEEQPYVSTGNNNTPTSLQVDLYMREFALPDDITEIPRQGYQGSYAVIAMELANDENGFSGKTIRGISAIKVINGEERDTFAGQVPENTMEGRRELLRRFRSFIGYLPMVGHNIKKRTAPVLADSYGVLLGIPFSNRVIDTHIMAVNHLPGESDYSLDALAQALGIEVHTGSDLERRCRKTWKLYCRMERSELQKTK